MPTEPAAYRLWPLLFALVASVPTAAAAQPAAPVDAGVKPKPAQPAPPAAAPPAAPPAAPQPAPPAAPPAAPAPSAAPAPPPAGAPAAPAPAQPPPAGAAPPAPAPAAVPPPPTPTPQPVPAPATPVPAPAPPAAPPPARASTEAEVDSFGPLRPAAKRSPFWLGAGLAFGVRNLPKLGVGATVLGELRAGDVAFDLGAAYWFENDAELSPAALDLNVHPLIGFPFPPGGSRGHFHAVEAKAAICPLEHDLRTGSLLGCIGMQGGALFVSSEGLLEPLEDTRPLFGFEAYARWHFQIGGRVGISYSAGVFVPMLRDSFGYRDSLGIYRELFRISPVGGRLDVMLTYGF